MQVSVYHLSELTGKHQNTIKKRVAQLKRDKDSKLSSSEALQAIYVGGGGTMEEVIKRLNIKRTEEIDLDMEVKRGLRIPVSDCLEIDNEIFQSIAGTLKANTGKYLNEDVTNEIFDGLKQWAGRLNGNGIHG